VDEQKRLSLIQYIGSGNKAFLLRAEFLPKFRGYNVILVMHIFQGNPGTSIYEDHARFTA